MNRVKKQLHEWDENLKDDSLPTNAVGQPLLSLLLIDHAHPWMSGFCLCCVCCLLFYVIRLLFLGLVCVRLLLQGGCLSAHR